MKSKPQQRSCKTLWQWILQTCDKQPHLLRKAIKIVQHIL